MKPYWSGKTVDTLRGSQKRLYRAWVEMRRRCRHTTGKDYKNYGGRGIVICIRWDNFLSFAADMGPHPGQGLTLERKNNDKNYCRGNCKWATRTTQHRNRRCTKLSLQRAAKIRKQYRNGLLQRRIARRFGVSQQLVSQIVRRKRWV